MPKLNRYDNQAKWFSMVNAYEQSALNKEQFCNEHNIKKSTFDYWIRKRLGESKQTATVKPGFVKLVPKVQTAEEIRFHVKGVDIYVPIQTNPTLLKNLIEGLIQ